MQAAFVLTIETGDDTDLIGIAEEISHYIDDRFQVISCAPWARPSLENSVLPTPPVVPGQQQKPT